MKRGVSQLDWALSLAIFILFVAWFFIIIEPTLDIGVSKDTLLSVVENRFRANFTWTLHRVPIFIFTDDTRVYKPIHVNLTLPWEDIIILGGHSMVVDDRIILVPNISYSPYILWLANGGNYSPSVSPQDLVVTQYWTSNSKNFSVNFDDSLYDTVIYDGEEKISKSYIYINDLEYVPEDVSYNDSRIVSIYRAHSDLLNHSTYVYAYNTIYEVYVEQNDPSGNLSYKGSLTLNNYSKYFSNNIRYGDFNYSGSSNNVNHSHDFITFYGNNDSVTFLFGSNTTYSLDYYNETVFFEFNFTLVNSTRYTVVFYQGDYQNLTWGDYTVSSGVVEEFTGLSLDLLDSLDYSTYKTLWGYPSERDFSISVWNASPSTVGYETTPLYYIGPNNTMSVPTISSKDISTSYLDKDFNFKPLVVTVRVW